MIAIVGTPNNNETRKADRHFSISERWLNRSAIEVSALDGRWTSKPAPYELKAKPNLQVNS